MITPDDFAEWKNNPVTQDFIKALRTYRDNAISTLIQVGADQHDFHKGVVIAISDVLSTELQVDE